ncbi:MAG: TonB-dependent receptor domain-containing protein [Terriglobales bacterium]
MASLLAAAQVPGISGSVRDAHGRALAGVAIELSQGARHLRARSGAEGDFALAAEPGIWRLRATRAGQKPLTAGPLTLQPGDTLLITWTPQGGRVAIAAGGTDHSETVKTLPLRGQAASELDTLVPGTGATGGTAGAFSVNGNRSAYNTYLVSGANDLDPFRQQEAIGQGGAFGAPAVLIPLGAIENIQVLTNASAAYTPSGAVLITTVRSGGAALHGSLFDYFDNGVLAANNFYNNVYGHPRQVFRNNQFGFTLGGPLPRLGGHLFASVEAQREAVGVSFASRLPAPQDIAAAGALVTQSGHSINPLGQAVLAQYPAALGSGPLSFSDLGLNNGNTLVVKADHGAGAHASLAVAYILGDNRQTFPQGKLGQGGGSRLPAYSSLSPTRVQLLSVHWRRAGSGAWSERANAGYSRFYELTLPGDQGFNPASIGLETGAPPQDWGLPEIDIAPGYYENLGASTGMPRGRVSDVYDYSFAAGRTAGNQQWSLGGEWLGLQENAYNDNGFRGYLLFNGSQLGDTLTPSFGIASLVDLLAGLPSPGATAIARGNSQRYVRQKRWGTYAQDQWQLSAPLQLTLGVRYDRYGVPTEAQDRFSNFVPGTGLVPVGPGGLATLYLPNAWDFSPRAAVAWHLPGNRILRGGWGLYFDPASFDQLMDDANSNSVLAGPLYNPLGASGIYSATPAAPVPFGPGVAMFGQAAAPQPPFDVFGVARNFPDPRVQVYHLALEQPLGRNRTLTMAYYGSNGTDLATVRDANQPTPGAAGAAAEQARRPWNGQFPQFRVVNMLSAAAHSNYNSLQISARSQVLAGLSLQGSYTWSKSLDDSSGAGGFSGGLPEDSRNLALDYGPSNFDQRQHLSLTYSYALPLAAWAPGGRMLMGGWQLNGITTLATGSPFAVTMANDNSGTGEFHDRPDLVGDPRIRFNPTGPYLNPAAFAPPPPGTYGNLGRNTFYGPGLNNFDLSLVKTTPLAGDRTLRLRAEVFNAFNHPNFGSPSTTFGSGYTISSTPDVVNPYFGSGGPRDVQLVAEILF